MRVFGDFAAASRLFENINRHPMGSPSNLLKTKREREPFKDTQTGRNYPPPCPSGLLWLQRVTRYCSALLPVPRLRGKTSLSPSPCPCQSLTEVSAFLRTS